MVNKSWLEKIPIIIEHKNKKREIKEEKNKNAKNYYQLQKKPFDQLKRLTRNRPNLRTSDTNHENLRALLKDTILENAKVSWIK